MKRIVLATALIAASTVGAFAQTAPVPLSSAIESQILAWVPGADLSNLTTSQYAQSGDAVLVVGKPAHGSDPAGARSRSILGAQ